MDSNMEKKEIPEKLPFSQKWIPILKTVSVEPAILCTMTSLLMTYLLNQNLYIENICRVNRNNSDEVCQEILKV